MNGGATDVPVDMAALYGGYRHLLLALPDHGRDPLRFRSDKRDLLARRRLQDLHRRIGPDQLGLENLFELVKTEGITEMILATNSTLEGEATSNYIFESLKDIKTLQITRLALGVPLGGELEYVDGGTLMHAFSGRVNFKDRK